MSFYIYDILFLVVFSLAVGIFLWKKKHNLKREGIMYLYRTQVGIRFINYVGEKYKRTISALAFIGVIVGYFLMASMIYLLYQLIRIYLFFPETVRAIKIPPLMPLIPYLPEAFKIDFLPPFYFTYWIIAIAVIALFHEFAHGIVARRYDVKILTTGFGFLGPFLAAFVEPDEHQMVKRGKYQQIAILSAGVFTNTILAIIFFLLLSVFFVLAYVPSGALFNTYTVGSVPIHSIDAIDGLSVEDHSAEEVVSLITQHNIQNDLTLGGNGKTIDLVKVMAQNTTYYITVDKLKLQLEQDKGAVFLYEDFPALHAGLRGVIVAINDAPIETYNDLSEVMKQYRPGETITIRTIDTVNKSEETLSYELTLAEDPRVEGRAVIGIGYGDTREGVLSVVTDMFNFFKEPATRYVPRFNGDFVLFIYHLIWWLAIINLSVALINMWPVAIFDGGRMFMLTVWAITGSEKIGQLAFKIATYVILGALALLMIGWFIAIY